MYITTNYFPCFLDYASFFAGRIGSARHVDKQQECFSRYGLRQISIKREKGVGYTFITLVDKFKRTKRFFFKSLRNITESQITLAERINAGMLFHDVDPPNAYSRQTILVQAADAKPLPFLKILLQVHYHTRITCYTTTRGYTEQDVRVW